MINLYVFRWFALTSTGGGHEIVIVYSITSNDLPTKRVNYAR